MYNMQNKFYISPADDEARDGIVTLLQDEKLPVADLPPRLNNFFVAVDDKKIIGAAGIEVYDKYGLLRSVVVDKNYRNKNIAAMLTNQIEQMMAARGINAIYLFTETAQGYFSKKGYETVSREDVPEAIKQSSEFSHVCPVSAVVMKKAVAP
jgi:amino-acid N-acetyltransferase